MGARDRIRWQHSAMLEERLRTAAETAPLVGAIHDLAIEDPLCALRALVRLRAALADAEGLAVTVARTDGVTWRELGPPLSRGWRAVYDQHRHVDGPRRQATG